MRIAMRRLLRCRAPGFHADARAGVTQDAKSTPLTLEQFEATLHRALFIYGALIIVAMTAINAAIMAALQRAFT
jgi:hypothetical protein